MPNIQGIINDAESKINNVNLQSLSQSFVDFWKKDGQLTKSSFLTFYGPIVSIALFALVISTIGILTPCIGCAPVRWLLLCVYVYVLSIILLYKKSKQYCPAEKPVEDLSILATWPTFVFFVAYVAPKLISLLIPGIGFILSIPILGELLCVSVAIIIYSIALPYSQYLLIQRACQKNQLENLWTFYH